MKKMRKYILLLVSLLLINVLSLVAQENTKSQIIKWIDGEKYYIHTVAKGQGLYAIKKLYAVEEKDILEANPEVFDGLKLGQEIKIPFKKSNQDAEKYRIHIIEAGQTIYSISKIYNVGQEDIFKLNPETKNGYKINQRIKIPNVTLADKEKKEQEDKKTYKVRRKDTLYGLSKKFGVDEKAILAKNPIIVKEGLKKGQRIFIPEKEVIIKEALFMPVDTMVYQSDSTLLVSEMPCDSLSLVRDSAMNIVLMLPFELDITSFTNELEIPKNTLPKYKNKPFFEFYQSSLLTINQLKEKGYRLNLHVFNTKRDANHVQNLLNKSVFNDVDLIIGPVYKPTFDVVKKFMKGRNVPMINPILKGQNLGQHSNFVFDIFPDISQEMKATAMYLNQSDTSQIFLVHSGGIQDMILLENLSKFYPSVRVDELGDTLANYKELVFPDSREIDFSSFLNAQKHNLIVILSDDQAFVSNVYTKLNVISQNFNIQVFGRPKWERFENIDIAYLHRLNTVRLQSEFVDYKDTNVIQYVEAYRTLFNQEPGKYAFYAHDYTLNFVKYFYHLSILECLDSFRFKGFIFDMSLRKTPLGWKNTRFHFVNFTPDIELKELEY